MARSKKHLYSPNEQLLCEFMKTLDHPARPRILNQLIDHGKTCVTDIHSKHPVSKETLTGHLNKLFHHHLLNYTEHFPYSFYTIDRENLSKSLTLLINWCTDLKIRLDKNNAHEHPHHTAPDQ